MSSIEIMKHESGLSRLRAENRELRESVRAKIRQNDKYGRIANEYNDTIKLLQSRVKELESQRKIDRDYFKGIIADLESRARWVSVNERLPEHNGHVLVIANGCQDIGIYQPTRDEWSVLIRERYSGYVTHWQPLPDPPDEVTG